MTEHIKPNKTIEQRNRADKNKIKMSGKTSTAPLLHFLAIKDGARDLHGINKANQVNSNGNKIDNKNNFHFREPLSFLYYHYIIWKEKVNTPLTYVKLEYLVGEILPLMQ
nr:MAG TPA: hypothetical protein [Caudoviricetes sp.]